jgi:hypothetical protein
MDAESAGPVAGKRALTVCAYICGDVGEVTGDIERELMADLDEMVAAGASADMAVCIQLDQGTFGAATRYVLEEEPEYPIRTPRYVGPVNMGSPDTLMAFLDWCMETRPAEQYAIIIGSHGSGPKADRVYDSKRTIKDSLKVWATCKESLQVGAVIRKFRTTDAGRTIISYEAGANLDPSTWIDGKAHPDIEVVVSADRAIAFDDGSRSFLSIPDLRRALEHGVEKAGKPFAVVLFDACYMGSYEVLHEMQGLAECIVASAEAVPGAGMPYLGLLSMWARLAARGVKTSTLYGEEAVTVFHDAYQGTPEPASLLAVDMAGLSPLVTAMDNLASRLMEPGCGRPMIAEAVQKAARTSDPDFVYLADLAFLMEEASTAAARIEYELANTIPYLWRRGTKGWGPTVYLPHGPVPGWYKELAVAGTPWGKWVMSRA